MANMGKTENKGFEFTLNGTILDNHNLDGHGRTASLKFLSANRNKLAEAEPRVQDNKAKTTGLWDIPSTVSTIAEKNAELEH